MNELVRKSTNEITEFRPERHRLTVAALDYGIEEAKRIKNWEALETAVDQKIAEQKKFYAWWAAVVIDTGGRPKKTEPRTRLGLSTKEAEEETGMRQQRVSDLGVKLKKPDDYRAKLLGTGYRAAFLEGKENYRAEGTGENEWYTPVKYLDMARKVLGNIDLDPASSDEAQKNVQAAKYFTLADNGLTREWGGRVWLNPPYAQPFISEFVSKMVAERCDERVTAAIMLTHNYTDTSWFHAATEIADAICFTRGRIKFVDKDGSECAPTQGQAFFYFGDDVSTFAATFIDVGFVMAPWR